MRRLLEWVSLGLVSTAVVLAVVAVLAAPTPLAFANDNDDPGQCDEWQEPVEETESFTAAQRTLVAPTTPGCGSLCCTKPAGCVVVMGGCPGAMPCTGFLCPGYCGCWGLNDIFTGTFFCGCG